jgi:hypothetical protein
LLCRPCRDCSSPTGCPAFLPTASCGAPSGIFRGWSGNQGCCLLRQRRDHRGCVGLRDTEPLGQGGQRASGGIAEGAQRREEGGEEDVNPLIRFALAHAEQAPLDHLEGIGLEVGEQEEQPIFRCRQGAGLIDNEPVKGSEAFKYRLSNAASKGCRFFLNGLCA